MTLAIATLSRLLSPLWSAHSTPSNGTHRFASSSPMPLAKAHVPLRVTRLAESRMPRHLAGRMVISGRIDEVCQELERLEAMGEEHPH